MKKIVATLFIILPVFIYSQNSRPEIHCKHFFYGYPFGSPETNDLIIRDIYALSNNDQTKFADWVAYRLTAREVLGDLTVKRKWTADPWLSEDETLEPESDYKGAFNSIKTNRGHQAPLAAFKGSVSASQTNYLSNITPQMADLNQGAWVRLENAVRDIIKDCKVAYIMTGPLYEEEMPSLPNCDEPHKIPSAYWKIICVEEAGEISAAAFIFNQDTPRNSKLKDHLVTIDEIEERSGFDFLWLLDDAYEREIEGEKESALIKEYF